MTALGVGYTQSGSALIPGAPTFNWLPNTSSTFQAMFLDGGNLPTSASLAATSVEFGNSLSFNITLLPGQWSSVLVVSTDSNQLGSVGGLRTDYGAGARFSAAYRPGFYHNISDAGASFGLLSLSLASLSFMGRRGK